MVALHLEELEPRLVPSVTGSSTLPAGPPGAALASAPQSSVQSQAATDALGKLMNQLAAGSRGPIQFFENLNAWIYLSLLPEDGQPPRPETPDAILASMWAPCEDRNLLMKAVAQQLGFQAASVAFYNLPYQGNHVATAIDIDGAWRFFDSTTGIYFTAPGGGDPLSYAAATADFPNVEIWQPKGLLWTGVWHKQSSFTYVPLQQNVLHWKKEAVFSVEVSYFPRGLSDPDAKRQVSGDFTGDGLTDVASCNSATGKWYVAIPQPDGSVTVSQWGKFHLAGNWQTVVAGDFNGDGRDDLAVYNAATRSWWVGLSTTQDTFTFTRWLKMPSGTWGKPLVGDFTGNGTDDIAFYHRSKGTWWVAVSQGDKFVLEKWAAPAMRGWGTALVGDFTGDGSDDLVIYRSSDRTWWVALSQGNQFVFQQWAAPGMGHWGASRVGDFTGAGHDDLAVFNRTTGTWWVALPQGDKFVFQSWGTLKLGDCQDFLIGDFDGTGRSDIAVYQVSTQEWWVGYSTGSSFTFVETGGPVTVYNWSLPMVGKLTSGSAAGIAIYHPFNALWWADLSPTPPG